MRLPESFLEELRARIPLAALIGRRVKLARSGRNWKGCCPFHNEKTPSFYVYDDGYHCFGCGAHGDAVRFVMDSQGASFREAVETLASEAGMDVPKPSAREAEMERQALDLHAVLEAAAASYAEALFAPEGAEALAYLRGRGLSDETIRRFGLGWAGSGRGQLLQRLSPGGATPSLLLDAGLLRPGEDGTPRGELFFNRVMFPIRDRAGRVISFGGRITGDGQPKYVNGPETAVFSKRRALYGLDLARASVRGGAAVIAVEGYMDVIALHQAGFGGAVAPLGTALTEEQLELLWVLSPAPALCFDGDSAGARAAVRAINVALPKLTPDRTLRIATLPAGEDPDTLVRQQGRAGFEPVLNAARPLSECLFDLMREAGADATPEGRAAFRKRLEAAAARIGDRALSGEYRRTLLDRFFQSGRRDQRHAPRRMTVTRSMPNPAAATAEGYRMLAAILLRHPTLLARLEEAWHAMAWPPRCRRLLEAAQDYSDASENLDSEGVIAHLTGLRLADDLAWCLGSRPLPLPACASADAAVSDAEAGWREIYGLMHHRSSLDAEIGAAGRDFARDPSPATQGRIVALRMEQQRWCGGHGHDEAVEDDTVPEAGGGAGH